MSCYAIVGPHRSGTSAVAGVLYHLGLFLGDDLLGPGKGNVKGHFEDREFLALHDKIIGNWENPQVDFEPYREAYTALIRKREAEHQVWGLKDPRLCFVAPHFLQIAHNVKVVLVYRDLKACTASLQGRNGFTREKAAYITAEYDYARRLMVHYHFGASIVIEYEWLIDNPSWQIQRISEFIKDDMPITNDAKAAAMNFIDPTLCHHKEE